jgi:hypothetical protein
MPLISKGSNAGEATAEGGGERMGAFQGGADEGRRAIVDLSISYEAFTVSAVPTS